MAYDEQDDVISGGAEYSPKSEFSKARVVEEAVKKCFQERSKEMKEGYYNYKFDDKGMPLKTWVPDQREVFNACVDALRSMLSPEIKKNKKYIIVEDKIDKKKETLFDKYSYDQLEPELNEENKVVYKNTNFKYIPKKGERVLITQISTDRRLIAKELIGGWDRKVDFYLDEMVKLNDKLFAAINELIDSLNYFKQKMRF